MEKKKAQRKVEVRIFIDPALIEWLDGFVKRGEFGARTEVVTWLIRKAYEEGKRSEFQPS